MSLVSEIMRYATPLLVDRVAAAVGVNSSMARMALTYAVPAILSAFAAKAATPAGASSLLSAVQKTDPGLLGAMEGALGGAGKDQLLKQGSSVLGSLLGQGGVDGLVAGLVKNAGLGSGAAAALLPLAGQLALGGLAKGAPGLDATGLANMLSSQRSSFDAAMPKVSAQPANDVNRSAPAAAAPGGGLLRWLLPLAAVLAGLWWYMSSSPNMAPVTQEAAAPATTAPAAGPLVVEGVDVGSTLTKTFGDLTTTVSGITDAASATAAMPKLQESVKSVESLSGLASKFSVEQKTAIGALLSTGLPAVKAAVDKAIALPGVGAVVKPITDGLFAKIEGLAK